ncbi:MAG: hypothetical protein HYY05_05600 [Chloroflexi bacterium]|nr:hypothetical protein [Chloroflexota bacterium]
MAVLLWESFHSLLMNYNALIRRRFRHLYEVDTQTLEIPTKSARIMMDRELTEDEAIVFQAGTHTDTMSIQYADFERLVQPAVADFRALSRYV